MLRMTLPIFAIIILFANCTISIPPITLTGPKTAAEKQIVGEEKYIEKNTWLIASVRSVKQSDQKWEKLSEKEKEEIRQLEIRLYRALRTLEFFDRETLAYRNEEVIGETVDGKIAILIDEPEVKNLPPSFANLATLTEKYKDKKHRAKLVEFVKRINLARDDLRLNAIEALDPKLDKAGLKKQTIEIESSVKKKFKAELGKNHWYQTPNGKWEQVLEDEQFFLE